MYWKDRPTRRVRLRWRTPRMLFYVNTPRMLRRRLTYSADDCLRHSKDATSARDVLRPYTFPSVVGATLSPTLQKDTPYHPIITISSVMRRWCVGVWCSRYMCVDVYIHMYRYTCLYIYTCSTRRASRLIGGARLLSARRLGGCARAPRLRSSPRSGSRGVQRVVPQGL